MLLYNENIPLIKIKDIDNNKKPWIYNSIIKCIIIKNKLYTKVLKNKTNLVNLNYYKHYKNILGSLIRR